jgi:hypothetical protein
MEFTLKRPEEKIAVGDKVTVSSSRGPKRISPSGWLKPFPHRRIPFDWDAVKPPPPP